MNKLYQFIACHKVTLIVWLFIAAYIIYFSYFAILRMHTLYASYFDLGIMNQTVYNTYRGITTLDGGRILEMTNPFGPEQMKRMAIHNDILLALLAPFYFLFAGPETLLVLQSVILALGALAIYLIAKKIFFKIPYGRLLALVFTIAYLLYPPMQRANQFDFHAVTLATPLLLFMVYFYLSRRYSLSFLFFIFSLLSKEQVALTTAFFGGFLLFLEQRSRSRNYKLPLIMVAVSIGWFLFTMLAVIPFYRGENHFALKYYGEFGDSPFSVIVGVLKQPNVIFTYLLESETLEYIANLLGPLGFLSFLSPWLYVASPEFAVNILSNSNNMQNLYYHYQAVLQPFIFLSALFGVNLILKLTKKFGKTIPFVLMILILTCTIYYSYLTGPLPYAENKEVHPFKYPQVEASDVRVWADKLKDEKIIVSATGQLSPFFTSRRYFYIFSDRYSLADYVLIRLNEVYNYPEKHELIPIYEKLKEDYNYKLIYKKNRLEVYKRK